jgi:hypothetical protein
MVVYSHVPIPEAEWINNTIDLDTGCVFGGKLTALRYPEKELISVPAARVYCEPIKPLLTPDNSLTPQQELDDVLDLADVTGKRIIHTRLRPQITIQEANSIAALEVMIGTAATVSIDSAIELFQNYCWQVESIDDLQLAPFHLLATENAVHTDKNHLWHLDRLAEICQIAQKDYRKEIKYHRLAIIIKAWLIFLI